MVNLKNLARPSRRLGAVVGLCGLLLPALGCGPELLIPIAVSPAPELSDPATLEIVVRSNIASPLPLRGSKVAYSQLGPALTQEISAAAQPWVMRNRELAQKTDGWQLVLVLTEAEATYNHGRARVNISLRARLHTRVGNRHLSQTQTFCQQTAEVAETAANSVFAACLHDLRTELSRWLGSVNP